MIKLKNGAIIVKEQVAINGIRYVAAHWPCEGEGEPTEWVTYAVDDTGHTEWGHYFGTKALALRDLDQRVKRAR
jgi:hypothetical protein